MMRKLFFFCATAYVVASVPLDDIKKDYPRFIQFPDGEGNLHNVDLEEQPDMELLNEIARNPADNLYLLFTRANPAVGQVLEHNNPNSIRQSNYRGNLPTVVIVHGWLSNQNTGINPMIRDACLERGDVNVIVLDWRRLANSGYVTAVSGVPNVGRGLGQFLSFLFNTAGGSFSLLHLAGFSLGGHLVGNAGRELGGRVGRITGLDPAGPLWVYNSDKISASDGVYVEGIHSDGNYVYGLGIGSAIGHVDFFPNGGSNQPGCLTGICDHNRAWELFAATINHYHLIGNECNNSMQITLNTCRGQEFPMGNNDMNKRGRGIYRLNTGRNFPF